jgi:hypothetical protein
MVASDQESADEPRGDYIEKFQAKGAIGKKRKSAKCR